MPFNEVEREAWRAEQCRLPKWRPLYGWVMEPVVAYTTDNKPQLGGFTRKFSHVPGTILLTAPGRTKGEPRAYLVWRDQSVRAITMEAAEKLALVKPEARLEQEWKEAA